MVLLQFTVENHLSFREPVTLSMLAPPGATGPAVRQGARPVMTVAAIYGANASGKSNVVKAMKFAIDLVTRGVNAGEKIENNAFRLSAATRSAPTRFQFDVLLPEGYFSYGIAVTTDEVVEEWLFRDDIAVFEREGSGAPTIGAAVPKEDVELWGFVAKSTRPNQPFLHEAEDKNLELITVLTQWLRNEVAIVSPRSVAIPAMAEALHTNEAFLEHASELLRRFGTGVQRIVLDHAPPNAYRAALIKLRDANARLRDADPSAPSPPSETEPIFLFEHSATGDPEPTRFGIIDESDGTRRLLELASVSFVARHHPGPWLFVIDELDRSLHPLLSRELVREFITAAQDGQFGPQMIFTTHDTNLLSADLLPPPSIWFTEKNQSGATSLYSLAEFDPTQLTQLTADLERGYLNGRFGAIPFVAHPGRLGWKKPETAA